MASLTTIEKQILEKLFQMRSGFVLNFYNRTMEEFFRDELGVEIYSTKYEGNGESKANHLRSFWHEENDDLVGLSILKLIEYLETQILIGNQDKKEFSEELISKGVEIGKRLVGNYPPKEENTSQASFDNGNINISLQAEIFDHVQKLLENKDYFHAVEESYKLVRKKLKEVSGKEKATDAFCADNIEKIFGHKPIDDAEKDFFDGIKYLHMAIQFLRNEKVHTPAMELDKNLAIHYISLASLAYDLISRNK